MTIEREQAVDRMLQVYERKRSEFPAWLSRIRRADKYDQVQYEGPQLMADALLPGGKKIEIPLRIERTNWEMQLYVGAHPHSPCLILLLHDDYADGTFQHKSIYFLEREYETRCIAALEPHRIQQAKARPRP